MKVNLRQDLTESLLDSAISRDKLKTDFQASLDFAKQNQSKRNSRAPEPAAMNSAMEAALKELQDYIDKGPIAHMREAILREMGLSEEDIAAMPPEQQAAVEEAIADLIKEKLLAEAGVQTRPPAADEPQATIQTVLHAARLQREKDV